MLTLLTCPFESHVITTCHDHIRRMASATNALLSVVETYSGLSMSLSAGSTRAAFRCNSVESMLYTVWLWVSACAQWEGPMMKSASSNKTTWGYVCVLLCLFSRVLLCLFSCTTHCHIHTTHTHLSVDHGQCSVPHAVDWECKPIRQLWNVFCIHIHV